MPDPLDACTSVAPGGGGPEGGRGEGGTPRAAGRVRSLLLAALLPGIGLGGCMIPRTPVDAAVTSPFGLRWQGALPGVHRGVDIRAPEGTPVRTMAPGRVRFAGWMDGYGNVVWIDHRHDLISVYAHLSRIDVSTGGTVGVREVLGLSGSTGNVTGPHLHFEVWKSGRPVDPIHFLGRRP